MLSELMKVVLDPKRASEFAERNRIGKTKVSGVIVSTVVTGDLGPETAILDKKGTYPVQRYSDKIEAKRGHDEWVEKIKTLKTITQLGFPGLTNDKEITLVR
jgi:hypothetical protein